MNQSHTPHPTPAASRPANDASRRDFIWLTLGWLTTAFALAASGFTTVRSLMPNVLYEPSRRYKAGRPAD